MNTRELSVSSLTAGRRRLLLAGAGSSLQSHLDMHGPMPTVARVKKGQAGALLPTLAASGLRGRGGGWFPTATKMRAVVDSAATARKPPVVIANAMEGEPESHKDAALLHRSPHLVIDGLSLAAATTGATDAYLALHSHSPVAAGVMAAMDQRRRARVDPVAIQVVTLEPNYVASQESALAQAVGGGAAVPAWGKRTFEKGSFGRPTLVQNVETLAHLALIARHGADWFRSTGTSDAPGTALVSVSGAVASAGVVEVDVGTRVRSILELAGGPTNPIQAYLTGGYGGSFAPANLVDAYWSPDRIAQFGGVIGAGVLVAVPASECGIARTAGIVSWMANQSAGQCGPCRFGLAAIADDFAALASGNPDHNLAERLNVRLGVIPGRGACRHPDGVVRLAASALSVFAADVGMHLHGRCIRSAA